jgi:hypothetical protein
MSHVRLFLIWLACQRAYARSWLHPIARCGIIKLDDAGQPRIKLYK